MTFAMVPPWRARWTLNDFLEEAEVSDEEYRLILAEEVETLFVTATGVVQSHTEPETDHEVEDCFHEDCIAIAAIMSEGYPDPNDLRHRRWMEGPHGAPEPEL